LNVGIRYRRMREIARIYFDVRRQRRQNQTGLYRPRRESAMAGGASICCREDRE